MDKCTLRLLGIKEIEKYTITITIMHGDVVWGSLPKTNLAALQRLQTRALEIIKNAKIKHTSSCPGMSVENIGCFDTNATAYKIIHKFSQKAPNILKIVLSTIQKSFNTQPLRTGIIRLLIYVSSQ